VLPSRRIPGCGLAAQRRAGRWLHPLPAEEIIARIRTDFDSFSELEARVLENHGYLLADAAIRRHVPQLASSGPPPARPPFGGEYFDERILRRVLFASRRRTLFGRFPEDE
jgi:hypothetical protein